MSLPTYRTLCLKGMPARFNNFFFLYRYMLLLIITLRAMRCAAVNNTTITGTLT